MKRLTTLLLIGFSNIVLTGQLIFNANTVGNAILLPEYEINTPSFEFSPVFYRQYIAFVYDKGNAEYYDNVHNTPYFDLAYAAKNTLGNLARKASFKNQLSSKWQEGPFCFYNNDSATLFTRTDPLSGLLKIFTSENINGVWTEGKQVELLGLKYNECHPSISESGNMMVFAAATDQQGSDMDLYLAEMSSSGWANIARMQEGINSKGNDWFPRFVGDSIILFSSDRIEGLGGLDIYATRKKGGNWSLPERAPDPINSEGDDFGLIVGQEIAYFSSNRPGIGKDDLYRIEFKGNLFFSETEKLTSISVTVKDKLTLKPIREVRISAIPSLRSIADVDLNEYQIDLIHQEGEPGELLLKLKPKGVNPIDIGITDTEGRANINIKNNQAYILELSANGYSNHTVIYDPNTLGNEITLVLEPRENTSDSEMIIPTTEGSIIIFDNIYYDFNSHMILEGAGAELDLLASTMQDNPNMIVELSAHTDSRGTRLYNRRLSEKRASSARDYLINKGISPARISTKGYCESQLRNHCDDRTNCTEEEHSFNRRTEVKVISN